MEEALLENCSFFEKNFSQPSKCIILIQLSMYSLLLHPSSLLSSCSSLKSFSFQNQDFENLISLNSLSKPARCGKLTNLFLTGEITRHSGIETSFSGLYIHKKNGNLAKTCVWSCCCEIILRKRNCHRQWSCCYEIILRTRNCRPKFIKTLLPEKHKENM